MSDKIEHRRKCLLKWWWKHSWMSEKAWKEWSILFNQLIGIIRDIGIKLTDDRVAYMVKGWESISIKIQSAGILRHHPCHVNAYSPVPNKLLRIVERAWVRLYLRNSPSWSHISKRDKTMPSDTSLRIVKNVNHVHHGIPCHCSNIPSRHCAANMVQITKMVIQGKVFLT